MPQYAPPAYLADYVGLSSTNQATDYNRMREEIERQKQEREAALKKQNSFGNKLRGAAGQLLGVGGAVGGAMLGGPIGGAIGGGLGSTLGSIIGPSGTPNNAASMAMTGAGMGSYLSGGYGGRGGYGGYGSSANGASYSDSAGLGSMSDADYQRYLDSLARGG